MAVTEQERHRILTWFEAQMGPDLGGSMMELLSERDATQVATKTDIAELRAEVKDDMLHLQRTFITWLVASQGAVIAAIGVATGLVLGLS
jgi:hypothetical protein